MPTKQQLRQAVASHLYDADLSIREVAEALGVSVGKAHQLKKAWEAAGEIPADLGQVASEIKKAMAACTLQQAASREAYGKMLSALSDHGVPRVASNLGGLEVRPSRHHVIEQARKVVGAITDEHLTALVAQLLQWADKDTFADITFEEIYRFTRDVCPNTERRNALFLKWMETQAYPGGPDDPNAAKVAVADPSPTSAESEAPVEVLQVATADEIFEARRWAETVLYRYEVFRLHSDHANLVEIARNEEALFSEEQVVEAQAFVDNPLLGKRPGE